MEIIKFAAEWCGPCKIYASAFDRVEAVRSDIKFTRVDIDENPELAESYQIMSVPTTVAVRDGVEVGRMQGAKSTSILSTFIDSVEG